MLLSVLHVDFVQRGAVLPALQPLVVQKNSKTNRGALGCEEFLYVRQSG